MQIQRRIKIRIKNKNKAQNHALNIERLTKKEISKPATVIGRNKGGRQTEI